MIGYFQYKWAELYADWILYLSLRFFLNFTFSLDGIILKNCDFHSQFGVNISDI